MAFAGYGIRVLTPVVDEHGVLIIESRDRRSGVTSAYCPLEFPSDDYLPFWPRNVPRWAWTSHCDGFE